MKTVILSKPVHRIFEDAAKSFVAIESSDTLCFGVQDWAIEEIKVQKGIAQGKLIAYQSELLCGSNLPFRNDKYVEKLRLFDEIWEYSLHNIFFLQQNNITNTVYKPLLPSPILKDSPLEKDIDILHYGSWTRHRTDYLNHTLTEGFKVYDVIREHGGLVFGDKMHQLILRSKLVLGIHSHPQSSIQESFRYQYPLSNEIDILAEKSLSNPLQIEEFSNPNDLVQHLLKHGFNQDKSRAFFLQNCFFPSYDSYQEEALSNVESNQLHEVFDYALQRMDEDSLLAFYVRKETERTEDVDEINVRLFNGAMWLTMNLEKTFEIKKKEKKSMLAVVWTVYDRLNRPSLQKKLLSTGGKWMPKLRCLLLLNGWRLFSLSLKIAAILNKDQKLIHYITEEAYT